MDEDIAKDILLNMWYEIMNEDNISPFKLKTEFNLNNVIKYKKRITAFENKFDFINGTIIGTDIITKPVNNILDFMDIHQIQQSLSEWLNDFLNEAEIIDGNTFTMNKFIYNDDNVSNNGSMDQLSDKETNKEEKKEIEEITPNNQNESKRITSQIN